ncbi:hypothetical protein LP420_17760 [Massilia sp. B-10]|nr:hypothetical protein LP420_17760 [Massilia sp. B-10]
MRAFAARHPWARKVGLVLQFDAIGNSGPLLLTSSRGRRWQADRRLGLAPCRCPLGSSMLTVLTRFTPGLLEAGPLDQLGNAYLRFANIEGRPGDRRALDAPARVDPATLQHTGDTMLALVRHFGNRPLSYIADTDDIHFRSAAGRASALWRRTGLAAHAADRLCLPGRVRPGRAPLRHGAAHARRLAPSAS